MAGFALRALGMVFRVFVAARLGPEGMGLYQLILSVYMVFVSLASAGINVASTRLGAQCLTRGRGMAPTLRSLAATAAVLGTAAMLAQLALADPLARFALHDSRAELGLYAGPQPAVYCGGRGAAGVLLARRRVEPNIIAQLVEQTVRMAVAALALVKLAHWGAAYACCAVLIGNTVSEAVSCGIMALFARQEPSFRPCADDPPAAIPAGSCGNCAARDRQPVGGQRFAGRGKRADPRLSCRLPWHPRRSRGAVWFLKKAWHCRLSFFRSRCWRHFPAC